MSVVDGCRVGDLRKFVSSWPALRDPVQNKAREKGQENLAKPPNLSAGLKAWTRLKDGRGGFRR